MKDIKYIVYNEQASLIMDNLCDLIELVYNFKVLFCDSIAYIYYHLLAILIEDYRAYQLTILYYILFL